MHCSTVFCWRSAASTQRDRFAGSDRILEEVALLVPVGPTKKQLLVRSTWDGLPGGRASAGPCDFYRELTSFQVRYADYRNLRLNLSLNGQPIAIQPSADTVHCRH